MFDVGCLQVDRSLSPSSVAGERSQNFSSPPGGPVPGGIGMGGMRSDGRDSRGEHGGGARPQEGGMLTLPLGVNPNPTPRCWRKTAVAVGFLPRALTLV